MAVWKKVENDCNVRPQEVEISGGMVIVRRQFHLIPAETETIEEEVVVVRPEHYEYEEWQMTKEAYEVYKYYDKITSEQEDALIELASLIDESEYLISELLKLREETGVSNEEAEEVTEEATEEPTDETEQSEEATEEPTEE